MIQVDGNTGYCIDQAVPTIKKMEDLGKLGAVEQPVHRKCDMSDLASKLHTPIMADEAIYGPEDAIEIVKEKAASLALLKISKHGGIEEGTLPEFDIDPEQAAILAEALLEVESESG